MFFPLLLDLRQTGAFVGFSFSTVRHWTYGTKPAPKGWPRAVKVGNKSLRYLRSDLEAFVANLVVTPVAVPAAPLIAIIPEPTANVVKRGRGRPRKHTHAKGGKA